ncbi:phosphotransferase enzyme family protein [Ectobacillus ponti]|uniref:Phosphotransferase n=1 Tax=Ectobacillus ponti TaxID=2961894 RepID=A0AA41X2U5_9BACI|nr:phosphotransferase [Ectobacillus ponti]MCP8967592.1 phosphotransferase [Ectobacillus ponti]
MRHDKLQQAAALFGGDHLRQQSGGFQNEVYACDTEQGSCILRLSRHKEKAELQGELAFIQSLKHGGVRVAAPILSRRGLLLEEISEDGGVLYAAAFETAPGGPVNVHDRGQWSSGLFRNWGRTVGRMHRLATENAAQYASLPRPIWQADHGSHATALPYVSTISEKAGLAYEGILRRVAALPRTFGTFGLIHNDLHQGNFFVENSRVTMFDFDDCAFSWFAQDIAVSYYHAIWQGISVHPGDQGFPEKFLAGFFAGYREEHTLTAGMLAQIPLFLKLREGFLYMLFMQHWDQENLLDWQAYTLQDLRRRIECGTAYTAVKFEDLL